MKKMPPPGGFLLFLCLLFLLVRVKVFLVSGCLICAVGGVAAD